MTDVGWVRLGAVEWGVYNIPISSKGGLDRKSMGNTDLLSQMPSQTLLTPASHLSAPPPQFHSQNNSGGSRVGGRCAIGRASL